MRRKVCFAWSGFPQYAARCVGAFVKMTGIETVVLATRPKVPIAGMEDVCGCRVVWIGPDDDVSGIAELQDVSAVFLTGWHIPAFLCAAQAVRRRGGRAICMVDNGKIGLGVRTFRRLGVWTDALKSVRFRLKLRGRFDGFMVPGRCGRRLLEGYGVAPELITEGMYAADATVFRPGPPLAERPKRIIYVGQFCERKNVKRMLDAFVRSRKEVDSGWELHLYGSGPLKGELTALAGASRGDRDGTVEIHDFLQPEELAAKYREARIFCLPSLEEHWGLVVHEAALSGCVLALSEQVGAAADLAGRDNAVIFDPASGADMRRAMREAMDMSDDRLVRAQRESLALSGRIGLNTFVEAVKSGL